MLEHVNLLKHIVAWLLLVFEIPIVCSQTIVHGELKYEIMDTVEMKYFAGDTVVFEINDEYQVFIHDTDTTFEYERRRDTIRYVFGPSKIVEYGSNELLRLYDFGNMVSYNIRTSSDTSYIVTKFRMFEDWKRERYICGEPKVHENVVRHLNFDCRRVSYLCDLRGQEKAISSLYTNEIGFSLPLTEPYDFDEKNCAVRITRKVKNESRGLMSLVEVTQLSKLEVEEEIGKVESAIFRE